MMLVQGVATSIVAAAICLVALPASSQSQMPQQQAPCAQTAGYAMECIKPSATDPDIQRFDSPNVVLASTRATPNGQLLLFLPGTGGDPSGPKAFLQASADAGYRVISLEYNDDTSVAVFCPKTPDPACSGTFRAMRIYGNRKLGNADIDNTPAEAIVNRFIKLVQYLERAHPRGEWGGYLENGRPNWRRIVVAGQSQGAGMAAFIAKQRVVARVILFSSPWDFVNAGGKRELAPWLALPSQTPPARWFGGYHARENMAALLVRSYAELKIPQDHIAVFNNDLPPGNRPKNGNPFHGQGLNNPANAEQRAFFLSAPAP